jgi:guanylate kinase
MRRVSEFDYVVVNERVDAAVETIRAIITAEKCRVAPRRASTS